MSMSFLSWGNSKCLPTFFHLDLGKFLDCFLPKLDENILQILRGYYKLGGETSVPLYVVYFQNFVNSCISSVFLVWCREKSHGQRPKSSPGAICWPAYCADLPVVQIKEITPFCVPHIVHSPPRAKSQGPGEIRTLPLGTEEAKC